MTSTENLTALNYLTDAAHMLRTVAPSTSAHLMSQRATLLKQFDLATAENQRQHICAACGHIMIPGQGSQLKLETIRALQQKGNPSNKKRPPTQVTGLSKEISCGFCHRTSKIALPAPPRLTRRKAHKTRTTQITGSEKPSQQANTTNMANSNSKKRAKNRKAGLQSLLQQQRQSNPLSLADFMMK